MLHFSSFKDVTLCKLKLIQCVLSALSTVAGGVGEIRIRFKSKGPERERERGGGLGLKENSSYKYVTLFRVALVFVSNYCHISRFKKTVTGQLCLV